MTAVDYLGQVEAAAAAVKRNTLIGNGRHPIGQLARDIEPEHVSWLWPGRLAAGKMTVQDGDPGLGKSTETLDIAARISQGEPLPGSNTPTMPRGVVILSAEDGAADTIVPRLKAAGADLSRVYIMTGVQALDGGNDAVALPGDLGSIEQAITDNNAALLIVDPLMAYLGTDTNAHRDQDVRRALAPLAAMLERTGCAGLLVRHLNKTQGGSVLYRGGGSIGIIGAVRFGLLLARDPEDDEARILAPTKCNIGPHPPALRFRLQGVPGSDVARVVWDETPVSIDAAALLAAVPGDRDEGSALSRACDWLEGLLVQGPRAAAEVLRDGQRDGHAEKTIKRAKREVGVKSARKGFGPGSKVLWYLPEQPLNNDPPIEDQAALQTRPVAVGAVCGDPRNDAENDQPILSQANIPGQPPDVGPVCDVGAIWALDSLSHPNGLGPEFIDVKSEELVP